MHWSDARDNRSALIRPLLILVFCWTTPHVTWSREQCARMRSERHVRALPPRRTVCGAAVVNDDRSSNADQYTGAGSMVVVIEKACYCYYWYVKLPSGWSCRKKYSWCRAFRHVHCVSKNVPPLQLAVIFTHTVPLRQFLAHMLARKQAIKMYFIFPPHLASASALPGETGNPEIASFHLNVAYFSPKKHETQLKISPWSELNHPSLSKQSTGCTWQDL